MVVGRELGIEQAFRVELAIFRAEGVYLLHFAKLDAHHAGAHAQAPATTRLRFGANPRIA